MKVEENKGRRYIIGRKKEEGKKVSFSSSSSLELYTNKPC
jgi:hypothetical protein